MIIYTLSVKDNMKGVKALCKNVEYNTIFLQIKIIIVG